MEKRQYFLNSRNTWEPSNASTNLFNKMFPALLTNFNVADRHIDTYRDKETRYTDTYKIGEIRDTDTYIEGQIRHNNLYNDRETRYSGGETRHTEAYITGESRHNENYRDRETRHSVIYRDEELVQRSENYRNRDSSTPDDIRAAHALTMFMNSASNNQNLNTHLHPHQNGVPSSELGDSYRDSPTHLVKMEDGVGDEGGSGGSGGSGSGNDESFTCDVCNKNLNSQARLERHLKTHLEKKCDGWHVCMLCDNHLYSYKYNLKRHLKKAHQIHEEETMLRFMKYVSSKRESKQVTSQADEKDRGFPTMGDVDSYSKSWLHPPPPDLSNPFEYPMIQPFVGNSEAPDKYIKEDVSTDEHTIEGKKSGNIVGNSKSDSEKSSSKPHCTVCLKEVSTKWSLKRHMERVHNMDQDGNTLPSKVHVPNPAPGSRGPEVQQLRRHPTVMRTCHICQKQVSTKWSLKRHMEDVHRKDRNGDLHDDHRKGVLAPKYHRNTEQLRTTPPIPKAHHKTGFEARNKLPSVSPTCPICQKQLYMDRSMSLRAHLREVHNIDVFGNEVISSTPKLPPPQPSNNGEPASMVLLQ